MFTAKYTGSYTHIGQIEVLVKHFPLDGRGTTVDLTNPTHTTCLTHQHKIVLI